MTARISPHDSLIALLHASGIAAKGEDTGGGCLAVIAPLPEGGEAVMSWEGDSWGVSLTNAAGRLPARGRRRVVARGRGGP
ncbi:MAG: hypothetical protein ACR2NO_03380 [Chloroflexota bacterium]